MDIADRCGTGVKETPYCKSMLGGQVMEAGILLDRLEKKVRRLLEASKGLPEGIRGYRIRGEEENNKMKGRTKKQYRKIK